MTEKEQIERATAEAFLKHYNKLNNTSYKVVQCADAPDIRCEDQAGNKLSLEITLTEDDEGDIQALLGRSNKRSPEALREHLAKVKAGQANIFDFGSCQIEKAKAMLVQRIQSKLNKNYGSNVALVVRDTSGVSWDWEWELEVIKAQLKIDRNPFELGIWIISSSKDEIFQVV